VPQNSNLRPLLLQLQPADGRAFEYRFAQLGVTATAWDEDKLKTRFANLNYQANKAAAAHIPSHLRKSVLLLSGAEELDYFSCGWGDEDAAVLCDALLWAHANGATSPATVLHLGANKLTDACVPRLMEVLSAGAVPELKELYLYMNALTDACVPRLVEVLSAGAVPKLEVLNLIDNALSDAGMDSVEAAGEARGVNMYV